MKFSIIIPVKPAGLVTALEKIFHVDYPLELFEIIIAEGCRPSTQRNIAARKASGEILYFLDDDSLVNAHFLHTTASHYRNAAVSAVGGPSLTPGTDSLLQTAIGHVLASLFGSGGNRNRYRQTGEIRQTNDNELILCNLSFRREVFLDFGGLDERLYPNEENELMNRLKKAGKVLIHDPGLAIFRSQRKSYVAFVRQIFGYGKGRAEQVHIGKEIKFFTLIPSLFILYLLMLPLFVATPYVIILLVYLAMNCYFSFSEGPKNGYKVAILCLLLFPTLHLSYGAGFISGLIRPRFRKISATSGKVEIKIIKTFAQNLPF